MEVEFEGIFNEEKFRFLKTDYELSTSAQYIEDIEEEADLELMNGELAEFNSDIVSNFEHEEWNLLIAILSEIRTQLPLPPRYLYYLALSYYETLNYIAAFNICFEFIEKHDTVIEICLLLAKCFTEVGLLESARKWQSFSKTLGCNPKDLIVIEKKIEKKVSNMNEFEKTFLLYMKDEENFIESVLPLGNFYLNALGLEPVDESFWENLVKEVEFDPKKLHETSTKSDMVSHVIEAMHLSMYGTVPYKHKSDSKYIQDNDFHSGGFEVFRLVAKHLDLGDLSRLRRTCRLFNSWGADDEIWKDRSEQWLIDNYESRGSVLKKYKAHHITLKAIDEVYEGLKKSPKKNIISDVVMRIQKKYAIVPFSFLSELKDMLTYYLGMY